MNGVGAQPLQAVFVPGLMGAGILISGAILLVDGVRKLMPNLGLRRRMIVVRAVHGVVEGAARAAGYRVPEHGLLPREPRSRWAYLGLALILGALGALVIRAGVGAFVHHGTLHGNPWAIGLGLGGGVPLIAGGAFAAFLAAMRRRLPRPLRRLPRPLRRLIATTALGRPTLPPANPRERARALHPWLEGKEFR